MPAVTVGDVTIGTHSLTKQAQMLESVCRRIGLRLHHWLRATSQSKDPVLPTEEFIDAFRYWQAALLGLLKEQRERAKLQGDAPTEEQLQAQFADELRRALETFNDEERAFAMKLWAENQIAAKTPTTETEQ